MSLKTPLPLDPALRLRVPTQEALPFEAPTPKPPAKPKAAALSVTRPVTPRTTAPAPEPAALGPWAAPVPTFTFLCGPAGSGKTFETRRWAAADPGVLLTATTGIAAINLGGETINATLGYFDTASQRESYVNGFLTAKLGKLWKAGVRRIILDEVSMLPAEQLTYLVNAIEEVNGRGYVIHTRVDDDDDTPPAMGLTLVGDFLQLAPVKASYAFEAPVWEKFESAIETLTTQYRQADPDFLTMLRAARRGHGETVAEYFTSHNAIWQDTDDHFEGATILAKNEPVDRFNSLRMAALPGREVRFSSHRWGKLRSEWGTLEKPPSTWGIPERLTLKIGALVMLLANRRDEGLGLIYVNGDMGTIVDATDHTVWVTLQRTGETIEVEPITRQVKIPVEPSRKKELKRMGSDLLQGKWEVVGEVTYLPVRIAYASTTHRSQGLSLDRVQINIRDAFFQTPGMLYVALSRARTAEGLRLVGSPKALIDRCKTDPRVRAWL